MVVGAGGAGTSGPLTQFATAVRRLLGAKLKLIQGYKGSAEIRLALARGELQGVCGIPISTLKTEWKDDWSTGRFKIIIQLGRDRHPDSRRYPARIRLHQDAEDRQVFDLIFGLQAIGRPFTAPPGVPAERVAALRFGLHGHDQGRTLPGGGAKTLARRLAVDRRAGAGVS